MPKWLNRVRNTLKTKTRSGRHKLQNLLYKARRAVSTKKQREKLLEKRFETLKHRMAKNNPNWERNYKENQQTRKTRRQKQKLMNEIKTAANYHRKLVNNNENANNSLRAAAAHRREFVKNTMNRINNDRRYRAALAEARAHAEEAAAQAQSNVYSGARMSASSAYSASPASYVLGEFGPNSNW